MPRPTVRFKDTNGVVVDREMNDVEFAQFTKQQNDFAAALLLPSQTTINAGIRASIAAKRMSATWVAFTQAEVNYLNSVNQ